MKHQYHSVSRTLSNYIRSVLTLEGGVPADPDQLPLVTAGSSCLVCRLESGGEGLETVMQLRACGNSVPDNCWTPGPASTCIAFFFKSFALSSLLNIPAAQLKNGAVDLAALIPHEFNALRGQLIAATNLAQKIEAIEHFLMHKLEQNKRACELILRATDRLLCDPRAEIITELQKELGLTERTFQRNFKKYVGITASHYRRICQFQESFTQLRQSPDDLGDVVYNNGFADQSHFIRTFKEFTQTTPLNYLKSGLKPKS